MRFFEAQREARRNTVTLAVLFCLTVIILSLLNAVMMGFFLQSTVPRVPFAFGKTEVYSFIVSSCVFVFLAWVYLARIPDGPRLAAMVGGRALLDPKTDEEKRLKNIVEEMAIASGVPIPQVYILEGEDSINAFAAGTDPGSIVIGVTKGAVTLLSRDELQGVIGHEFSHLLNEDLKLNMRLAAVVMTFLSFVKLGRALLGGNRRERSYSSRSRGKNQGVPVGLALLIFGALGYFMGRLMQSMISRQREYLADASSAQFTRNPESLARALAKINLGAGSGLNIVQHEYAHIFFAEGFMQKFSDLFATHPPVMKRVAALLPNRRLDLFLDELQTDMIRDPEMQKATLAAVDQVITGKTVLASIGSPTEHNHIMSEMILAQIAPSRGLLEDPSVARGALALLTFHSQDRYAEAKSLLRSEFSSEYVFDKIAGLVESADPQVRVSLFQFALSTLKNLSARDKEELLQRMDEVFKMDQKFSLLEVLLFVNARLVLQAGNKGLSGATAKNGVSSQAVLDLLPQYESIDRDVVEGFISANRDVSLIKKKEILQTLIDPFLKADLKEELRLLCLAIKVPVPPF